MPEKTNDRLAAAEASFKTMVLEQFDLESDFVDTLCSMFRKAADSLCEGSAAPKRRSAAASASSKPKKSRKKSAYNVFVREMMKTEDIRDLDHKQKMGAIAKLWKELDEAERAPYADLAKDENDVPATEEA